MRILHDVNDAPSGVVMSTDELLVLCSLLGLPEPPGMALVEPPATMAERRAAMQSAARSLVASGLVTAGTATATATAAPEEPTLSGIPKPLAALISVVAQAELHAFVVRGNRHQLEWWHLAERAGAVVEHVSSTAGLQTLTPLLDIGVLDRVVELALPDQAADQAAPSPTASDAGDRFVVTLAKLRAASLEAGHSADPERIAACLRAAGTSGATPAAIRQFARALAATPMISNVQVTARSGHVLVGLEEAWLDDPDGGVWLVPSPLSVAWTDPTADLGPRLGEEWVIGRSTHAAVADLIRSGPAPAARVAS